MDPVEPPFEFEPRSGLPVRVAATIGVFDGVHLGHQELFRQVLGSARGAGARSMVLTFDPYPVEVFAPSAAGHRIASRSVTRRLIQGAGIDFAWFLPFSRQMAAWEPEHFLDHVCSSIELVCLWVGPDFRFGRNRSGDFDFLLREGERRGFDVRRVEPLLLGDRPVSSTWIRELIRDGDVTRARELLGHPFEVEGLVVHGQGLGAKELVATANLGLGPEQLLPRRGIYAGRAFDPAGRWTDEPLPAVASVGVRPTLGPGGEDWLEVHVLDWQGNIYGERLAFRFHHWLRAEVAFEDVSALRKAIVEDVAEARRRLAGDDHTSPLQRGR